MGLPAVVPIWQYHAVQANGDGWRFMFSQNPNVGQGWTRDGIAWYAFATPDGGGVPIYQYHAVQADGDGWRFTYSLNANLGYGWTLDGVAWYGFATAIPNSVPIYQYHAVQANGDGWRFTFSTNPNLGYGWTFDGVAFYCLSASAGTALDYGVQIASPGNLVITSNNAYNFGTDDFSVTALFRTTSPGTIVSRKSTEGGSSAYAGWLVVLKPDGSIKFATDNGFGFYEVDSVQTAALNGQWHHVAAIRRNGQLEIWLDGVKIAVQAKFSLPTPLNVTSGLRVLIGGTDQQQEPYNQFVGTIEDVTIWNYAISTDQITDSMFNLLTGREPGLVGFWPMDNSLVDQSPTGNNGTVNGHVSFVPVFHATWVQGGMNAFSFASVVNLTPVSDETAPMAGLATGTVQSVGAAPVTRVQSLIVPVGAPFLFVSVSDPVQIKFPTGVQISIQDPSGKAFTQNQDTPDLYVRLQGTSVWHMVVRNPAPGSWTATIDAPDTSAFQFWFQTLPNTDIVGTMMAELGPVYGYSSPSTHIRKAAPLAAGSWSGWGAIIGGIGLGGIAVIAAVTPGGQGIALWAGTGAALSISVGAAQLWGESAGAASLTSEQVANQASSTAGFTSDGKPVTPSLAQVWSKVIAKVGDPATTNPAKFVSRTDMGIDDGYFLQLDIGGEGRFTAYGITSGFENALNANAQTTNSQTHDQIPMLIHLQDWSTNPPYPFKDGTINYITMQGAPLTEKNVHEIARLLAPGGRVGLWIVPSQKPESNKPQTNLDRARELASLLNSTVLFSCAGPDQPPPGWQCNTACQDEFNGEYPITKICIADNRAS